MDQPLQMRFFDEDYRRNPDALPALMLNCIQSDGTKSDKLSRLNELIEQHVISHAHNDAELYFGCLLKGFAHTLYTDFVMGKDLAREIDDFFSGNYRVIGRPPMGRVFAFGENNEVFRNGNEKTPYITINDSDYLALTKIIEKELSRNFGNPELAKRLTACTARLSTTSSPDKHSTAKPQEQFADALVMNELNPFEGVRIFEFSGRTDSGAIAHHPIMPFFKSYYNYKPIKDHTATLGHPGYISLEKPGPIFAPHMDENDKYDYVIAGNIFCSGASISGPPSESKVSGARNAIDVLPHLANILKDGGTLVVSNTAKDGYLIESGVLMHDRELLDFGLRLNKDYQPLLECERSSGLATYQRDYGLREPVAFTHEEYQHDRHTENRYSRYLTKIIEQRDRPEEQNWGQGF